MVIHSVMPAQMLMEQEQRPATEVRQVQGGYLEGQQTAQGFQMTRLVSTDPAMYLQSRYSPGSIIASLKL